MASEEKIRLIVTGDDFGRTKSVNAGILRAHREGILTSASLMVNEERAEQAVELARQTPSLAVGLHVSLVCGKSALKPSEILGVVDNRFRFDASPLRAAVRYYFNRALHVHLKQEVDAQIRIFRTHGLKMDHLSGHVHFHLHPTVFRIIKRHAHSWGLRAVRVTRDPLFRHLGGGGGRPVSAAWHALLLKLLCRKVPLSLARRGIRYTDAVFGLHQSGRITESYLVRLLEGLGPGTYELYAHPDESEYRRETDALCSPKVRQVVEQRGIELTTYSALPLPKA